MKATDDQSGNALLTCGFRSGTINGEYPGFNDRGTSTEFVCWKLKPCALGCTTSTIVIDELPYIYMPSGAPHPTLKVKVYEERCNTSNIPAMPMQMGTIT